MWDSIGLPRIRKTHTDDICWTVNKAPGEPFHVPILAYADDIVLLAPSLLEATAMVQILTHTLQRAGLDCSAAKSSWAHLGVSAFGPQLPIVAGEGAMHLAHFCGQDSP